jgi:hypothetical protein
LITDYVLSDPIRRQSYDQLRASCSSTSTSSASSADYYRNFFKSTSNPPDHTPFETSENENERPDPEEVFGDVFEDLLKPEVNRHVPIWTWVGAGAGAALGFIVGNLPGAGKFFSVELQKSKVRRCV